MYPGYSVKSTTRKPVRGDMVIVPGGGMGIIVEVRAATEKSNDNDDKFWNLMVVRKYWLEHHKKDIGDVKYLVDVVFLNPKPPEYIYPDTMITILKNPISREYYDYIWKMEVKDIVEDDKRLKKEALRECVACKKPIKFFQRRKYKVDYDISSKFYIAHHAKCVIETK